MSSLNKGVSWADTVPTLGFLASIGGAFAFYPTHWNAILWVALGCLTLSLLLVLWVQYALSDKEAEERASHTLSVSGFLLVIQAIIFLVFAIVAAFKSCESDQQVTQSQQCGLFDWLLLWWCCRSAGGSASVAADSVENQTVLNRQELKGRRALYVPTSLALGALTIGVCYGVSTGLDPLLYSHAIHWLHVSMVVGFVLMGLTVATLLVGQVDWCAECSAQSHGASG